MTHIARRFLFIACAACFLAVGLGWRGALQAEDNSSVGIAQTFLADGPINDFVSGALVSVKTEGERTVQLASPNSTSRLVGVVNKAPLVTLSGGKNEVEIAISGTAHVLVSDINGEIHTGDKITTSPIEGIGMLAATSSQVIGAAQANFDAKTAATQTIKKRNGTTQQVRINTVPVAVNVSYYQAPTSGLIPPIVQNIADAIAGRPVSLARVIVSTTLLIAALVGTGVMLYGGVRSGIISLGRNPLAAGAIRGGLLQVSVGALLILGFGIVAAYFTLTL